MQVRVRTTIGGIAIRLLLTFALGVVVTLWLYGRQAAGETVPGLPTLPTPAASSAPAAPQASTTPLPTPATAATAAQHGVTQPPPGSSLPPGGTYFLGIYIPPPGK